MEKSFKVLVLFIIITLFCWKTASGQDKTGQKKIETIVNLTRFIDWSNNESFNHSKKMLYVLTDIKSKMNYEMGYRNTAIYRDWEIICSDKIMEFDMGSVVYVTKSKEKYINGIIGISNKRDILTISDNVENFCEKGGMINILEQNGEVKFEINYRIIQDKSLDISSKLLALSKIYR